MPYRVTDTTIRVITPGGRKTLPYERTRNIGYFSGLKRLLHQPHCPRPDDRFGAAADAELAVEVARMCFDRAE